MALNPDYPPDQERARLLVDIHRRPFVPAPFLVGKVIGSDARYLEVEIKYGPNHATTGSAWVDRTSEVVHATKPSV